MKFCAPTKNRIGQLYKNIITATLQRENFLEIYFLKKEFNFSISIFFAVRWGDITKLFKNFNQN